MSVWDRSRPAPVLSDRKVHIWRIDLLALAHLTETLAELLSADERDRAQRYRFARDRSRYVIARGAMRLILGEYLQCEPAALRFSYGPQGKPRQVPHASGDDDVRFNLSHSHWLAILVVTRRMEVGVDVEFVRRDVEVDDLIGLVFTPRERAIMCSMSGEVRLRSFYRHWTVKEAVMKATGQGMALHPSHIEVVLHPDCQAARASIRGDATTRWSLHEILPAPGYIGALAVERHDSQIQWWDFRPCPLRTPGARTCVPAEHRLADSGPNRPGRASAGQQE